MAVVNRTFQAVITVLDRTAAPLRAIAARLRGLAPATLTVGQNLALLRERLAELAQSPAMQRLGNALRLVGQRAVGLLGIFRNLAFGLTLLATAAGLSAAGLVGMVRATVDEAGALNDLSARIGTSVQDLLALRYAAGQVGVEAETLTSAMERLQKGVAEAAGGKNENLAELFRRLRIPLRDANGQIRSAADLMPELADAFAKNENAALRTRMAVALFGRGGAPLIAMLQGGSQALREQTERWRMLHGAVSDEAVSALDEVGDRMDDVGVAVRGVRFAIVSRLAPALAPLLNQLAEWIAANRELIATRVAEWVKGVVERLQAFDWGAFLERMGQWATTAGDTVEKLGGMHNVLLLLGGLALAPLAAALVQLAAAFTAIGIAAASNPFGAAILAIGALTAALKLLYDYSDQFRGAIDGMAKSLRGLLELGERAQPAVPNGALPSFPAMPGAPRLPNETPPGLIPGLPRFPPIQRNSFQGGDAPGARPGVPRGELDIRVRFDDVPRGTRVQVAPRGDAPDPTVEVGYARMNVA